MHCSVTQRGSPGNQGAMQQRHAAAPCSCVAHLNARVCVAHVRVVLDNVCTAIGTAAKLEAQRLGQVHLWWAGVGHGGRRGMGGLVHRTGPRWVGLHTRWRDCRAPLVQHAGQAMTGCYNVQRCGGAHLNELRRSGGCLLCLCSCPNHHSLAAEALQSDVKRNEPRAMTSINKRTIVGETRTLAAARWHGAGRCCLRGVQRAHGGAVLAATSA